MTLNNLSREARSTVRIPAAATAALLTTLGLAAGLLPLAGCPSPDPNGVDPNDPNDPNGTSLVLTLVRVAEGLVSPVALAAPDDGTGRLFIADQPGVIWVITKTEGLLDTPLLDLRALTDATTVSGEERGLLGLAVHPDFESNNKFYVLYTAAPGDGSPAGATTELRLSEFTASTLFPNQANINTEREIFRLAKPQNNHNGGQLAFGPTDDYLYFGIGDGGGAGDVGFGHTEVIGNAQDKANLFGTVGRIDVDAVPYGIPPTNPFLNDLTALTEIYAYGFRNPWRFSFDRTPAGQARLFVADVGQSLVEEVNLVVAGGNYGWNRREGTLCFSATSPSFPPAICPDTGPDGTPLRDPILEYGHTDPSGGTFGSAVIGGYVYRGARLSGLAGAYVFGDYTASFAVPDGRLFVATESAAGDWSFEEAFVADSATRRLGRYLLSFGVDVDGELYVLARTTNALIGATGTVDLVVGAARETLGL